MKKCEPVETQSPFYYSLLGAVNHFGLTTNEIIDLAIKGEIILSVKISKEYTPYSMSVIEPEESKKFGFLLYTRKALKDKSMLPQEIYAEYLNLSVDDSKVLKTSILEQSVFQSAFCDPPYSYSEHILMDVNNSWVNKVKLDFDKDRLDELQDYDSLCEQAIVVNNLAPSNRERFINGVRAVQSGEYFRRLVLIDASLEVESTDGIEFLATSELNQTITKELTITQNDIEISSNYEELLNSVTIIPESSPYFVKPKLRAFNGLYELAQIGYQYFIIEDNKLVEPLKKILNAQANNILNSKKTVDAAVFFLNPKPHHNAGLHKLTSLKGSKCQFEYLLNESEKYWFDKCLDTPSDIGRYRIGFAEKLHESGYCHEKAIHGEFLSLPNNLKINEGVEVLNINKVFPRVEE